MTMLRVWAPLADLVELEHSNRRIRMTGDETGWWRLEAPFITHGTDYAFRINGEGPFPDPRSAWQPQGVHGPSRWVDHARYSWNDAGWRQPPLESAVIYELHVGTFTGGGGFADVIDHLDHLISLGITHVELMPVAEFFGDRGWGYDGVDLFAPHHAYGGPDGLKLLVDACHQRGLAVLLDVVYNHLGPSGNYLERFGPYMTDRYRTPWGKAVNLDGPHSDEIRRFFIDNALGWLRDYHIDGLRIDAVHAIVDTSAIHFLEQLACEVRRMEERTGRGYLLIAESDLNDPRIVRPADSGGYGIDAQWNEDFHHALHAVLTSERTGYYQDFGSLDDLKKVLTEGLVYDGRYSRFRLRSHGRSARGLSGHRFVGCLQNHDQVGNRAAGERMGHLLPEGLQKIGAALVLTAPFVPMLFQGEEWSASTPFLYFISDEEVELARAVRTGRQKEFAAFGWDPAGIPDPSAASTFRSSRLDWREPARPPHSRILEWYRALIALRRRMPELADGRLERTRVEVDGTARCLTMVRGSVVVACNLSDRSQRVPCGSLAGKEMVLSSESGITLQDHEIVLPPHTVAVMAGHNAG